MTQARIERINELARKSKTQGLTDQEKAEQYGEAFGNARKGDEGGGGGVGDDEE